MNTKCEVCDQVKHELKMSDPKLLEIKRQLNIKDWDEADGMVKRILNLSKFTYNCDCPQIISNELCDIRRKGIKISHNDRIKLMGLKTKKKDWILEHKLNIDNFQNTWGRSLISSMKTDKEGNKYQSNKIYNPEAVVIHNSINKVMGSIKGY